MEALDLQTRDIVVYQDRKELFWSISIAILFLLFIVGIDVFAIWKFRYNADFGAYIAAIVLFPASTVVAGWMLFTIFDRLSRRGPAIIINSQGFYANVLLRTTFPPHIGQSFIPWEEIAWISFWRVSAYPCLTLNLKDPTHYWSLYGHGKYREWHRDRLTGAHINISQYLLSLPASQILQRIEENFGAELLKYDVKVIR